MRPSITTAPTTPELNSLPLPIAAHHSVAFEKRSVRDRLAKAWVKVKREVGNGSLTGESLPWTESTDSSNGRWTPGRGVVEERHGDEVDEEDDDRPVDQVVVDNTAHPEKWIEEAATRELNAHHHEVLSNPTLSGQLRGGGGGRPSQDKRGGQSERAGSLRSSLRTFSSPWMWAPVRVARTFVKCSAWPLVLDFFAAKYPDKEVERAFQKELWSQQKMTHVTGAVFILFNYLLQIGLLTGTANSFNRVGTYIIGPIFSFCLIVMALFNWPRKRQWAWQFVTFILVWMGSCGFLIDLSLCDYYSPRPTCRSRDFLSGFYYASAFPVVAMFALGMKRWLLVIGVLLWVTIASAVVVVDSINFLRDMLPWAVFQIFMLFFHYMRETSDRRTYSLRLEVKTQFRAKQKAQMSERKVMEAQKRFQNYVLHEVRVPLNTAVLAVHNLKAANVFDPESEHAVEFFAIDSSLSMCTTVLNDVLDYARMEKGGFSSYSQPFSFHGMMTSILAPTKLDTDARKIKLVSSLDPRIDEVAVRALHPPGAQVTFQEGDGVVVGDETRIRQVINNLASNACKFTNAGGELKITTTLIYPETSETPSSAASASDARNRVESDTTVVEKHDEQEKELESAEASEGAQDRPRSVVVRIEVSDTGVGIRARDTQDGRLFTDYHQNETTLTQGGKGTGLGLSLVRHIVSFTGGRLGVKSRHGQGSTFWVEFPLGLLSPESAVTSAQVARQTIKDAIATPNSYSERSEYGFMIPVAPPPSTGGESSGDIGSGASSIKESDRTLDGAPPERNPWEQPISMNLVNPPVTSTRSLPSVPVASPPPSLPQPLTPLTTPRGSPLLAQSAQVRLDFEDGPLRVLVVDDDKLTRSLMSRMVTRLGCDVQTAENGAIALEMILAPGAPDDSRRHFDCVFLDNQMPVCTGLEVVARLKELGRNDFVVGCTANATRANQLEFEQAGASSVLTKPIKESAIREHLIRADQKRSQSIGATSNIASA